MKDINLFKLKDSLYFREVSGKDEALKDLDCDGFLIRSSEAEARKIIESLRSQVAGTLTKSKTQLVGADPGRWQVAGRPIIALVGGDDAFNRRAVESLKIDYLVSPEGERPKVAGSSGVRRFGGSGKTDTLKQRDSGLNHVVARIAKEKGVCIVVNMGEFGGLRSGRKERAMRVSRIMQNVKVCRKVGCSLKIASFSKNKSGVVGRLGRKAFGVSVGMSSGESVVCVSFGDGKIL